MRFYILICILIVQINFTNAQTSLKEINLHKGIYQVGFRHYTTSDSTRTYKRIYDYTNQSIPRPIPISLWYPAIEQSGNVEAMTVLNYMEILKQEEEWEYLPNEQILNWFNYLRNTDENQAHLKERTSAYSNTQSIPKKFPVIVYAPSYQASSIENFALCEFLASHGYVVIASPSRGTENRWLEGGTQKDMETQARDIEFLIRETAKFSNVDSDKIATMGFSFGGLSNVLSQMRNENIKAVVSLDGSIKYVFDKLKESPFFNLDKVDVPFIHMAQKDIPEEVLKADNIDKALNSEFEFYDSISKSKAYQLKFHNLTHSYFSTLGVFFEPRDTRQDKSDFEIMESYRWVSEYALNFLEAFLKNDKKALEFMERKPFENGVKDGLISLQKKPSESKSFGFNDFNVLAAKQHYENLTELYSSMKLRYPSIELQEGNLNTLGLQLMFNPKTSEQAINVFLLATSIYPNSANLFDSLAEAYLFIENNEKALENFEKSLKLNPQNQNAIDRLKQIEK